MPADLLGLRVRVATAEDTVLAKLIWVRESGSERQREDAALGRAYITVNKNAVPNDPRSPFVTSGLRLGTPAITTRGFGDAECRTLAGWIADVLDDIDDEETIDRVRGQVLDLCARYPVYAPGN